MLRNWINLGVGLVLLALLSTTGCTETLSVEVDNEQKVSDTAGRFDGALSDGDRFGAALATLGDLEGDGVIDLAVGAPLDDDGGSDRGAVWVLFMDSSGEVDIHQKISDSEGGFDGELGNSHNFGSAVAAVGDVNEDGVIDLVVGAPGDDDNGPNTGAVWILFLNADGTVRLQQKISNQEGGLGDVLNDNDRFGSAITGLGDLDEDGIPDIAVGAPNDDNGGSDRGAVWIVFLNLDGTVKQRQKISFTQGGFDGNLENQYGFGSAVSLMGDIDGDGRPELAVGVPGDDEGGADRGALWLLSLNTDGTVAAEQKVAQGSGEFTGALADGEQFGTSLTALGDLDNNGTRDLAVGSPRRDDGGTDRGAFWILFLNDDKEVISASRISDTQGNFNGALGDGDQLGISLSHLGDLDTDGVDDIALGADRDDDGGPDRGALWVVFMRAPSTDTDLDTERDLFDFIGGNQ